MDGIASLHIEILTTRERIEQLRSFWDSCAPCRDADLDFFLFITELFSETERPHVVVLYEHGTPRAVLIARLDRVKPAVRLGYHQLAMPTLRVLNVVHGGWLGDITGDNAKLLTERLMLALDRGVRQLERIERPPIHEGREVWKVRGYADVAGFAAGLDFLQDVDQRAFLGLQHRWPMQLQDVDIVGFRAF